MQELIEFLLRSTAKKSWDLFELQRILFVYELALDIPCPIEPATSLRAFLSRQKNKALSNWLAKQPVMEALDAMDLDEPMPLGIPLFANADMFNLLCSGYVNVHTLFRLLLVNTALYKQREYIFLEKLKFYYLQIATLPVQMNELSGLDLNKFIIPLIRLLQKGRLDIFTNELKKDWQQVESEAFWQLATFGALYAAGSPIAELRKMTKKDLLCGRGTIKESGSVVINSWDSIQTFLTDQPSVDHPLFQFNQRRKTYRALPHFYPTHPAPTLPSDYDNKKAEVAILIGDRVKLDDEQARNLIVFSVSNPDFAPSVLPILGRYASLQDQFTSVSWVSKNGFIILRKIARYLNPSDERARNIELELLDNVVGVMKTFGTFYAENQTGLPLKLIRFNDLLSSDQITSLSKVIPVTFSEADRILRFRFHYRAVRRFVEIIKRANKTDFNYFSFFKFIMQNLESVPVNFRWNKAIAFLFLYSNFLDTYVKDVGSGGSKYRLMFPELKNVEKLFGKFDFKQKASYLQWKFILSCPQLFSQQRSGGALLVSDLPKVYGPLSGVVDVLSEKDIPDDCPVASLKRYIAAFKDVKAVSQLTTISFCEMVMPAVHLDDPLLARADDMWEQLVQFDAEIIHFILIEPSARQRLDQLLANHTSLVRRLLSTRLDLGIEKSKSTFSLLRFVMYLPEVIFNQLMENVVSHSDDENQRIILSFLKENSGLWQVLHPQSVLNKVGTIKKLSVYYHAMRAVLSPHSVQRLNALTELIISKEKNMSALFFIINVCLTWANGSRKDDDKLPTNMINVISKLCSVFLERPLNEGLIQRLLGYKNYFVEAMEKLLNAHPANDLPEEFPVEGGELEEAALESLPAPGALPVPGAAPLLGPLPVPASLPAEQVQFTVFGRSAAQKRPFVQDEREEKERSDDEKHRDKRSRPNQ